MLILLSRKNIILCLTAKDNESDTRCVVLGQKMICANSDVLKYVLECKADGDNYDSDDALCYDPELSKDPSKSITPFICIGPLLTAMLDELNEESSNLYEHEKKNRLDLQELVNIPSEKIWEVVRVWQTWVQTGDIKLSRCPFQRERMLKFARIMEMPEKLYRAVKKHEVDEKLYPTEDRHVMWKAGLYPEQNLAKEEAERAKY